VLVFEFNTTISIQADNCGQAHLLLPVITEQSNGMNPNASSGLKKRGKLRGTDPPSGGELGAAN